MTAADTLLSRNGRQGGRQGAAGQNYPDNTQDDRITRQRHGTFTKQRRHIFPAIVIVIETKIFLSQPVHSNNHDVATRWHRQLVVDPGSNVATASKGSLRSPDDGYSLRPRNMIPSGKEESSPGLGKECALMIVAIRLSLATIAVAMLSTHPALATVDVASVVLDPLAATTAQGLPNTPLGLFTFDLHSVLRTVNNDSGGEAVHNLQASAMSQYTTQYYACAARGGGCSTTPTIIKAQQNSSALSPQIFVPGEMALGQFTFTYDGALSFAVTAQNAPAADSYALDLVDTSGKPVALGAFLNGTYTLSLHDNGFASAADYMITTMPNAAGTGIGSGPGGSGGMGGSGASGSGATGGSDMSGSGGSGGSIGSESGASGSGAGSPGAPIPEPDTLFLLSACLVLTVGASVTIRT